MVCIGPGQLLPFEGIAGFNTASKSFPGTLFRFPLPRPGVKGKITISDAAKFLNQYYEEAKISMLFLEKVHTISFAEKLGKVIWSVRLKADLTPMNPKISVVTINAMNLSSNAGSPKLDSVKWGIISGGMDQLPQALSAIKKQERLEARYSLAALISEMPAGGFNARYFVGLPLQTSGKLGFPVHVNAVSLLLIF